MTAVRIRVPSIGSRRTRRNADGGGLDLLARPTEPALAVAIPLDRRVERHGIEVRPQHVGEIELGYASCQSRKFEIRCSPPCG